MTERIDDEAAPRIAVVGHTNTGKTSLVRTLSRDAELGEVADGAATTRGVEAVWLRSDRGRVLELLDTPGLERSADLLEKLEALPGDGPSQVEAFLAGEDAKRVFPQEASVLRTLLDVDAALYVIDLRDELRQRHVDELDALRRCGRPLVPVLNFVATTEGAAHLSSCRARLARLGLHAVAEFDAVVFSDEAEIRLLQAIAVQVERFRTPLEELMAHRRRERDKDLRSSAILVAELLVDAAAARLVSEGRGREMRVSAVERLRDRVRAREQRCVDDLLEQFRFRAEDVEHADLPLSDGQWGLDLFSGDAMRRHGVRAAGGAAAGAAAGAGLDLMLGFMSLGAATALGAAIGAAVGAGGAEVVRVSRQAMGREELRVGDPLLRLLLLRQAELIRAITARGHAAQHRIVLGDGADAKKSASGKSTGSDSTVELIEALRPCRLHPEWSSLSDQSTFDRQESGRTALRDRIARLVRPLVGPLV